MVQVVDVSIFESVFNMLESVVPEYDREGLIRGKHTHTHTHIHLQVRRTQRRQAYAHAHAHNKHTHTHTHV
jgi:crotonobetainyl-CoA:carnitine CoA-transferase CaiB-like acyl-CoA transferase